MPHLTVQLTQDGAVVDAELMPDATERADMYKHGITVPGPAKIKMLIDTGAQRTSIDETVVAGWGLTGGTFTWLWVANGSRHATRRLKFKFEIINRSGSVVLANDPLEITIRKAGAFAGTQLSGLIGLDVLSLGSMTFNKPSGYCSLDF
jgi:hypothetical protein